MPSVLGFVVGLLGAALSLLGFVQQHPELPQSARDQAEEIASQAIALATNALGSSSQNQASIIYDVSDLGVKFALPQTLSDLTYKAAKLPGEQAVNSVAFSSKCLESAGCGVESAPLGYLTYDNDKGGTRVGHARGSELYYIAPTGQCKVAGAMQNSDTLKGALQSLSFDATNPADFFATPTFGSAPLTVYFSANPQAAVQQLMNQLGSVGSLEIDYGDGHSGEICTPAPSGADPCGSGWTYQHTYFSAGAYTARIGGTCGSSRGCVKMTWVATTAVTVSDH